jgi:hypothetical protein
MSSPTRPPEKPDKKRTKVLAECMDDYGIGEETNAECEWPNNILSLRTVVYRTGHIGKKGEPIHIDVDPDELALCETLSAALKKAAGKRTCGIGSEADYPLRPFFICANRGDPVPAAITPDLIRAKFNGTILPASSITVDPLDENSSWWRNVSQNNDEAEEWRFLMPLFADQKELHGAVYVEIGQYDEIPDDKLPEGAEMNPSCFPRLFLTLTRAGSIVGLFGLIVLT